MWEPVSIQLSEELASVTTSVWMYPEVALVGVMRRTMLSIPTLWGRPLGANLSKLRAAPGLLTDLQCLLTAPLVYAEAEVSAKRNQALLVYLGFIEISADNGRKLYQRSI